MSYNTSDTVRSRSAKKILEGAFSYGEGNKENLIRQVADMHIRDRLVPPSSMSFETGSKTHIKYGSDSPLYEIHPHAMGQLCNVAGIPRTYVTRLTKGKDWERELLDHNLEELFHKGSYKDRAGNQTKFLHRTVKGELRGFLSRSFNRQLASLPLLRGFVGACTKAEARAVSASTSAVRFTLKCFLPYVFEPVEGEFVAIGATWSNSDFGAGRLRVAMSTMRISSGSTAVLNDVMSRVHIGSIIQDSDLEVSDSAAAKEVEAQVAVIQDVVAKQLSPEPVNRVLDIIAAAHDEKVPWHRLKVELGRLLQKTEVASIKKLLETGADDIIDLPPPGITSGGEPIATRWWASNVVSWVADKEQNVDRQNELQQLAGDLIGKK